MSEPPNPDSDSGPETEVPLRAARPADAEAVRDIYAPFVRESPATFRTEVPSVATVEADIREKREHDEYPWYVAVEGETDGGKADESGGTVVGYAFGSQLRERPAYRWAVETSIYVDPERHRAGVGTALYDRLLGTLRRQGYCSAYAALGMPNPESEQFHERHGFERVGRFPAAGFKLGEWHDVVWYHRRLRAGDANPAEPRPVSAVESVPPIDDG
ncbi:GNAT family N-acetyltransferase [Halobellus ordinarius]|uniref:GNAT family N-acetyltransferase n=1 Tax=Halobellus ordinarius TaxID=3075120 RepID=UPI002880B2C4|nr:N-acetyltransferase family protein [Halobellus sp. ZY16]